MLCLHCAPRGFLPLTSLLVIGPSHSCLQSCGCNTALEAPSPGGHRAWLARSWWGSMLGDEMAENALAFWWVAASPRWEGGWVFWWWRPCLSWETGWGERTALPSGQELCLGWVKRDECFFTCCSPPLSVLCLKGRVLCLPFASEVNTSPYSWSSCELCFQCASRHWVLTDIQTPSSLEFLGPFGRLCLCALTYRKGP